MVRQKTIMLFIIIILSMFMTKSASAALTSEDAVSVAKTQFGDKLSSGKVLVFSSTTGNYLAYVCSTNMTISGSSLGYKTLYSSTTRYAYEFNGTTYALMSNQSNADTFNTYWTILYVNSDFKVATSSTDYVGDTVFFSRQAVLKPVIQPLQLQPLQQVLQLVPMLILLLVGFLGLRKGLTILSQLLHQA